MSIDYKTKSRNTDFEQHANKIFTAIREINPQYAEKRAIWELFQNALDIVDDKGIIKISKTEKGLLFEHNGKPFNDGNLTGLIKQSSNGKNYGSNKNETGQYGTGFLSTHVYGKKILINASVSTDRGKIKSLQDFLIDREATTPDALNKKIQEQDYKAEQICDSDENSLTEHLSFTSFEYVAGIESDTSINNMFEYIHTILPFVFVFNKNLDRVEINKSKSETIYQRGKEIQSQLTILSPPQNISFLEDKNNHLKIILPQENLNLEDVPKLFLFYPLMNTQNIGINFLIHAQEFKPNKERDYLFLKESNPEIKNDVQHNKILLDAAFKLVIDKIIQDSSVDFLSIINIELLENEDEYFKDKKIDFINSIKSLKRISIRKNILSLIEIPYLHQEALNLEDEELRSIYEVLIQFYEIPNFDTYIYLSRMVNNWKIKDFLILSYQEIFNKIYEKTSGNYLKITNKESYQSFIRIIGANIELLNQCKVIPNIHNQFRLFSNLKKWNNQEIELINTMDQINANISQHYLHKDFYFIMNITPYSRENFKDDLNKFNLEIINLLEKNDTNPLKVYSIRFYSLISSLTYYINLNRVTQINNNFTNHFTKIYNLSSNIGSVSSPTVTLNYDSSFKLLARLYIKDLREQDPATIENSIPDLKYFVKVLHENYELKKNLLDKLMCFPSQLFSLKGQHDLKVDAIKDKDFKNIYKTITNTEIRNDLLLSEFEPYISHTNSESGFNLGDQIESKLNPSKEFIPIDKEILTTLLELISFMSRPDSQWSSWLPNLDKVKEEIMMSKFKDEETRSSLFNILSGTKERIQTLGKLAQIEDLDALVKAGLEKQKEERRKQQHLDHIKKIGIKIQDLIKNHLDASLSEIIKIIQSNSDENLKTVEEQNGQDFIIYKSGSPIYYIEVKSRWDSNGIVALSKRQIERCAQNKKRYGVITVNVADYKSRNEIVEKNISFEELIDDIYVNIDLGEEFEMLIQTNQQYEIIQSKTRLIEFRGHIPQGRIKTTSINFKAFIEELKLILLNSI